jgi:hypothetical protein
VTSATGGSAAVAVDLVETMRDGTRSQLDPDLTRYQVPTSDGFR